MRWRGRRASNRVEDRRGSGPAGSPRLGGRGGGLGVIVLALVALYFGVDPAVVLNSVGTVGTGAQSAAPPSAAHNELAQFVAVVLADTEDTWHALFAERGGRYEEPALVLFTGAVRSACSAAQSAMGPFYCPADRKVYIDLSFYDDLKRRYGAPGDFAQAYVIAHEVGHHVQTLLGISAKVHKARGRLGKVEGNQLSVRQELQADCFAGLWANHADRSKAILEAGDVQEALTAASAIGDDRLQREAQGRVVPESFTHGSSAQRIRWFRTGLESGRLEACDTFRAKQL